MLLFEFLGLQVMDALTTLLFLRHGVSEANPLVRAVVGASAEPALGLAISKAFAMTLALYAWHSGRRVLLRRMNLLFALCVVWNLVAIAVSPGAGLAG